MIITKHGRILVAELDESSHVEEIEASEGWDGESDFDCPHCGENVPYSQGMSESTVGHLFVPRVAHVVCPSCKECCGCIE